MIIFEVGASVILLGDDLQFVGVVDGKPIRFIINKDALKRLAESAVDLSPQEKFKVYDRNREFLQETGRRLYEQGPGSIRSVKIGVRDLICL